ncbi:MAG: hypothetical protein A4E30_01680 [Methanomassiliicoccales archaeon PtaB.Bin215]|nr:MAG: hypothetical protein A4E30_01680 [Methanomassiliicoccales archaeon PtaB.Bin215]
MQQQLLEDNPAFDPTLRSWTRCPKCGNLDIDHQGSLGPWQGCYQCRLLLNRDGHRVRMSLRRV